MAFSNVLPDPVNKITDAGVYDNSTGTAGPGFASVNFRSVRDTQVSRTQSGRGVPRSFGTQYWEIDIKYNPLTRDEFAPVDSFLMSRNGRRTAFYVALPQYASSRSSTFAATALAYPIYLQTAASAGATNITVKHLSMSGSPKPGDMFTITDPTDTNHVKAYKITRVETDTVYETAGLATTQKRIHFTPPLVRDTAIGLANITTATATAATDVFTTSPAHGLVVGQQVRAISGLTGGLTADAVYWVKTTPLTTSFTLSPTSDLATTVNLTNSTNSVFTPTPTLVVFTNPKIRCILKSDIQEYDLQTNNLYQFGLSLEEILP
jgi:hypothetical protein